MNVLGTKYIKPNMRILVNNNSGGETMYHAMNAKGLTENEMDGYIGAKHSNSIKGWVCDRGIRYLSAQNRQEFIEGLKKFVSPNLQEAVVFEVFTDKMTNLSVWKNLFTKSIENICFDFVQENREYLIYGAGKRGERAKEIIEKRGGKVRCFSDSAKAKWGKNHVGKIIVPPKEISQVLDEIDKIVIASLYIDEIKTVLFSLQIKESKIVTVVL